MKTKRPKIDMQALVSRMRKAIDVRTCSDRFRFWCYRCRKFHPITILIRSPKDKPVCPACAERLYRRKLKLTDFPSNEMAQRVIGGKPLTPGEAIRTQRRTCGLTQMELAKQLMISRQSLNRWERGRRFPNRRHSEELNELLNIDAGLFPALREVLRQK